MPNVKPGDVCIVLGEHNLFSDEEIVAYMQQQEIHIADLHRKEVQ